MSENRISDDKPYIRTIVIIDIVNKIIALQSKLKTNKRSNPTDEKIAR